MSSKRQWWRVLWTVERLQRILPKIFRHLGDTARAAQLKESPSRLVEVLELADLLELATPEEIIESLRDLGLLEIQVRQEFGQPACWFRTGTLAVYAAKNPDNTGMILATLLGYAEEPRRRSG